MAEDARVKHQRALRREQDITDREKNSAMGLGKEKAALERELKDLRLENSAPARHQRKLLRPPKVGGSASTTVTIWEQVLPLLHQ